MLLLQRESAPPTGDGCSTQLVLQAGGERFELPLGRTTIGSSPRCTMRIQQPGVQPLHCLITREATIVRVRRWAGAAWLNGSELQEAELSAGDCLSLGTAELRVVDRNSPEKPLEKPQPSVVTPAAEFDPSPAESLPWSEPAAEQQVATDEPSNTDGSWEWQAPQTSAPVPVTERCVQNEEAESAPRYNHEAVELLAERIAVIEHTCAEWQSQQAEWQSQVGDIESSLGDVVRAVNDLQQELAAFRAGNTAHNEEPSWGGEPVSSVEADQPVAAEPTFDWSSLRGESSPEAEPSVESPVSPVESETAASWSAEDHQSQDVTAEPADEMGRWGSESNDSVSSSEWPDSENDSHGDDAALKEQEELETASTADSSPITTSYIERFSHMFTDEGEGGAPQRPDVSPAHPAAINNGSPMTWNSAPSPVAAQPSPADSDEESIEQYMAKLLQRVRGDGPLAATGATTSPVAPPNSTVFSPPDVTIPEPTIHDESDPTISPTFWMNRKPTTAASTTDLGALRALANETARRAISTHALRKLRRTAMTKAIVSTLAGMTSLWLMLEAPAWYHYQFVTACVSLMVAAYWAGQTYRALLASFRIAASDGVDDDEDDEMGSPSQLASSLPIDVEGGIQVERG